MIPRAILTALVLAAPLSASVIHSGSQNLSVSWDDLEGVYINLETGGIVHSFPDDFDESPWINITMGGHAIFNSELIKPIGTSAGENYDPEATSDHYFNLIAGILIDPSSAFLDGAFGSQYHISFAEPGNEPDKFLPGESGFFGFSFVPEAGGDTHYGWLRLTPSDGEEMGTLVDWAYNDTPGAGIVVGAIPEPSALTLGFAAIGFFTLHRRRRKTNLAS